MSRKPMQILTVTNPYGTFVIHRAGFERMVGIGLGTSIDAIRVAFEMIGMAREAEAYAHAHRDWLRASEAQDALKPRPSSDPLADIMGQNDTPEYIAAAAATLEAYHAANRKLQVLIDAADAIKSQINPEEFVVS